MIAQQRAEERYRKAPRGYRQRALLRLQDATLRRLQWEIRRFGLKAQPAPPGRR